ncbi:hypothetical protein Scep_005033 [Stephania cephalantha]|uniref:Uncharacterized protein n=1 Tax=Stephania cephalantha TaxID=152367 RepID=A0AAP0KWG4_9MAGN
MLVFAYLMFSHPIHLQLGVPIRRFVALFFHLGSTATMTTRKSQQGRRRLPHLQPQASLGHERPEVGVSIVAAIETANCRRVCQRSCRLPSLPLKPSLSLPLKPSPSAVAASEALAVAASEAFALCHRCLRSPRRLLSLPLKLSPFTVAACEALADVRRCRLLCPSPAYIGHPDGENLSKFLIGIMVFLFLEISLDPQRSVREVAELYGSEKSFVVEVHRALSGLHSTALIALERSEQFYAKLRRRRLELTQATPDQPMDDEAVYFNVLGECPKGRFYGLRSLGRKKRRYADPGASTSQMPEMMPRLEFDSVTDQLWQVVAFM